MTFFKNTILAFFVVFCFTSFWVNGAKQNQTTDLDCNGINRAIVFAGLNWNSVKIHNEIAGYILSKGFGCQFKDLPISNIQEVVQKQIQGDIDVNMEIWLPHTYPNTYHKAVAIGDILDLGLNTSGSEFSFMVPRYVIEGDIKRGITAMAPDLKSITDLPRYAQVFQDQDQDPDNPGKGRFHNCIVGWQCELINNDKLATYGLDKYYTNFRPATSDDLTASLADAYKKGEPWLGYYWGPTWALGSFDMVVIKEPEYTEDCWVDGDRGCAFPPSVMNIAVSKDFAKLASNPMFELLSAYTINQQVVSQLLAFMKSNEAAPKDAALHFLKNMPEVWTTWVPEEVATRIKSSLNATAKK